MAKKSKKKEFEKDKKKLWNIDVEMIWKDVEFRTYLYSLLQQVFSFYEQNYFPKWVDIYKAYYLDTLDRQKQLKELDQEWRTNVRYPLIKMVVDTLFANFYDTNVTYKILPRQEDDKEKAQIAQKVLTWMMDVWRANDEIFDAVKEAMLLGTSFVKLIIRKEEEVGEYLKGVKDWKKLYWKYKRVYYYPSLSMVDAFSLFIDPAARKIENARFIFHRKIIPVKKAVQWYSKLLWINLTEKQINTITQVPYYISKKDYSKIKQIQFMSEYRRQNIEDFSRDNIFEIYYHDNDLIEVIEYYEPDGKLLVLFNWYVVYDDVSPYPFNGYPFGVVKYDTSDTIYGKWVGTSLETQQKIADIIWNAYLDQVKVNVAPMFEADKWSIMEEDIGDWVLKYEPYKILTKRDDKQAIRPISLVANEALWPQALQLIQSLIELSEWPNQYTMGGSPVERSATWASLKAQITKQRLKPLADSINRMLSYIVPKMLLTLTLVYPEKLVVRILWEDWAVSFEEIKPQDIIWQYDVVFETNTLKEVMKEIERNQLIQFIAQALPAANDPVRQRPVIDILELFKEILPKFDISQDVLLTDDKFKEILANLQATWQIAQQEAQEKVEEYQKKRYKGKRQEQPQITPEMLAQIAGNIPPVPPSPPSPEKEQQREVKRELYQMYWGGLSDILRRIKNFNW